MTQEEVIKLLRLVKGYKPALYKNMSDDDKRDIASAWYMTFKDYNADEVIAATQYCCANIVGIPDIAIIKNKIDNQHQKCTSELWEELRKALRVHCRRVEERRKLFNSLPEEVKRFVGSPNGLYELGLVPIETLNTVTRGQFSKSVDETRKNKEFELETSERKAIE